MIDYAFRGDQIETKPSMVRSLALNCSEVVGAEREDSWRTESSALWCRAKKGARGICVVVAFR